MTEGLQIGELELRIRDEAVEVALALRSRTLLRDRYGSQVGYEIRTGPRRDPLILLGNGDLKLGGPSPVTLTRAVISELNHLKGTVSFMGTNEDGVSASVEIRSTNPPY